MGAGSSVQGLPAEVDKAAAKRFAGAKFDEAAFDRLAKNGVVARDAFVEAAGLRRAPALASGMSCAEFICHALVEAGVREVFGGHGGALVPLVNAVCSHPDLTWVLTRNEANASLMAAASAKLHNGSALGACISTSGPAASNLVTGLLDAQLDRVPVIAITGCKPRCDQGHSEFQDIDQARLLAAGGLGYSMTVADPTQLLSVIRDAIATAFTKRCAVHVAVPVDIQVAAIASQPSRCLSCKPDVLLQRVKGGFPLDASVEKVAALLTTGNERICFAIGLEARDAGAEILALAHLLNVPVVTRLDAKGAINERDDHAMGVIGVHGKPGMAATAAVLERTTLVVSFAVSELSVLLCNLNGLQVRKLIEVATDSFGLATQFEAQVSIVADVAAVCTQLAKFIPANKSTVASGTLKAHSWWSSIERAEEMYIEVMVKRIARAFRARVKRRAAGDPKAVRAFAPLPALATTAGVGHCHPGHLLMRLGPRLTADDVVCVDTGDITLWTSLCLRLTRRSVVLSSERLGTMGYGLCAGVAASLHRGPEARAVIIVGDGGFQMTLNELGTAMQMKSRLIIIVIDNKVLGRVEFGFNDAKGCALAGPDYVALARAYGATGYVLTDDGLIDEALDCAFSAKGVFVLQVNSDPHVKAVMATYMPRGIVKVDSA